MFAYWNYTINCRTLYICYKILKILQKGTTIEIPMIKILRHRIYRVGLGLKTLITLNFEGVSNI